MNGLSGVIAASIGAGIALFCGIRLYDIKSDFATFIRRYGSALGVIFMLVTVFNFLLGTISGLFSDDKMPLFVCLGFVIGLLLLFILDFFVNHLCAAKTGKQSSSRLALIGCTALSVIESAKSGAAIGLCFTINFGAGMMSLSSMLLFLLTSRYHQIDILVNRKLPKRIAIASATFSVLVFLAAIIVCYLVSYRHYSHLGVILALVAGCLLAQAAAHLITIAKKVKK